VVTSPRGFRLSSVVGLIAIPTLINVATGGLPDGWGIRQWIFAGVAFALALVLAVREPPPEPPPLTFDAVMSHLAQAITVQWRDEFAVRRLNDPDPLPVAWMSAPESLTLPMTALRAKALAWWPDTPDQVRAGWASTTAELAGSDADLASVLDKIPSRRLVVLGDIGSGKTVALVRLVLRMLEARRSPPHIDPVPVMYSLASWDPTTTGLYEWLEARLANDHPMLREPVRTGVTWAREIIERDLLLPVLDGFDELPAELRARARDALNTEVHRRPGLILSCRTADYRAVIDSAGDAYERLQAAAAVEIQALDTDDAQRYLAEDAGPGERWTTVFAATSTPALAGAFSTPLQVSLARAIYNPRPQEPVGGLRHPDELTDAARFPDRISVDRHLFAGFLPAAYRRYPGQLRPPTCTAQQAGRWLSYLARWMELRPAPDEPGRTRAVTDLNWWELRDKVGPIVIGLSAGLPPAIAVGLVAYLGGRLGLGLGVGVIVALIVVFLPIRGRGRGLTRRLDTMLALTRSRRDGIVGGMAGGFVGGFIGGLVGGLLAHAVRGTPRAAGIMGGLGAGIGAGAIGGPRRGFAGGLAGGVAVGLTAGIGAGPAAGLTDGLAAWLAAGATVTLTGLRRPARELQALHYSKIGMLVGLTVAVAIGAQVWLRSGPQLGVTAGLVVGVLGGLAAGLEGRTVDPTRIAGPIPALRRDRGTFLMVGVLGGLAFGLGAAFGVRPSVGLAAGLTVGLVAACVQTSYGAFAIARFWLAVTGCLPWHLMRFLDEAHRLGVLRQAGAVYQFRHIELQRHLSRH
jgi:hypothetical protein